MSKFDMEYNSRRETLIIPEYGRHLQNLVNKVKTIDDPNERQGYVESILNLLSVLSPASKNLAEYKEKLWNHIFRIANYNLDVKVPDGVEIKPPAEKPKVHLPYPVHSFKYRHYGYYVQKMIEKAMTIEDPAIRQAYTEIIGSYMKLAYHTWNKEHYVNDEIIKQDLLAMTNGSLHIHNDHDFDFLVNTKAKRKQGSGMGTAGYQNGKNSGKSNGQKISKSMKRRK